MKKLFFLAIASLIWRKVQARSEARTVPNRK